MSAGFRRGVRLGVDIGSVRIGMARCDPDGILATPLEKVARGDDDAAAVEGVMALVREYEPLEIVAGQPRSLDGQDRASARVARAFALALARAARPVPVRLVDERLTTVSAHRLLTDAGHSGRRRRGLVDSQAAVLILQQAIEQEKTTGEPAGAVLSPDDQE